MKNIRSFCVASFAASLLSLSTYAGEPQATDRQIDRLRADLVGQSATQVLTQRCAELRLAVPAVIRAVRVPGPGIPPGVATRALLQAGATETILYRHVRLMCGHRILSEADNWYLPDKLTAEMNRQLDTTDTPFGTVVRPLAFHRRTLEMTRLASPKRILRVRALLVSPDGVPFSLVSEIYSADLVAH
jgi:hypothetical protein